MDKDSDANLDHDRDNALSIGLCKSLSTCACSVKRIVIHRDEITGRARLSGLFSAQPDGRLYSLLFTHAAGV